MEKIRKEVKYTSNSLYSAKINKLIRAHYHPEACTGQTRWINQEVNHVYLESVR